MVMGKMQALVRMCLAAAGLDRISAVYFVSVPYGKETVLEKKEAL